MRRSILHIWGERPDWFFDIASVIHPAFSVSRSLRITNCSEAFFRLFEKAYPQIRSDVMAGQVSLESFFLETRNYPYDISTGRFNRRENSYTAEGGIEEQLSTTGCVSRYLVLFEIESENENEKTERVYLEISMVPHATFVGLQSIMPIATDRVQDFRELREQYLGLANLSHRLRQPMMLISTVTANLEAAEELGLTGESPILKKAKRKLRHANEQFESFSPKFS